MWLIVPLVWLGAAILLGLAVAALIRFGAGGDDGDAVPDPGTVTATDVESAANPTDDPTRTAAVTDPSALDAYPEPGADVFVPAQGARPDAVVRRPQDVIG